MTFHSREHWNDPGAQLKRRQTESPVDNMKDSNAFDQIDAATIDALLKEYPNVVPAKLEKLDDQRYNIIPTAVKKRTEDASLSKSEVATLVEWKLYVLSL